MSDISINNIKEKLVKMIESIEFEEEIKQTYIEFIKSYDGTNHADFAMAMYTAGLLIMRVSELEVKAKGFDEIKESEVVFQKRMEDLKVQFEALQKGVKPPFPSLGKDIED